MPATLSKPEMQKRDLTARTLTLRAKSVNESDRSFEAVVATETPAQVFDMRSFEVIDEVLVADGGEFPDSVVLLDDHQRHSGINSVIGSASRFRQEGDRWIGRGVVGRAVDGNIHRQQLWQDLVDGHIDSVSIGYRVSEFVYIPAGQSEVIRGRKYTAEDRTLRITTQWQVLELSLTPIPADDETKIRTQAGLVAHKPRSYFR